ncbi:MAG: signal peptide peptidase SppA [Campylobacterota bacterium]|nr:signal peptide peptidase SppA [Campylobacterota bacterium]
METLRKIFLPITVPMKFIQDHFKAMIFLLILFLLFAPTDEQSLTPNNLQEIHLVGPIMEVTKVVEEIETARNDAAIKGVLFVVDSPGGAVAPSVEVAYAIKRLSAVKPVVAYAQGSLASGGYYASVYADEIIANPGSMVGSIGVIMQGANVGELMQKIGIKSQYVKAGKYKQVGTPDREWTSYEKNELNKVIQGTYEMFVADVAAGRDLNISDKDFFANAHIFTAMQAKKVGLVDEIGVKFDAKSRVKELSQVEEARWNKEDKFDKFMKQFAAEGASLIHIYFPELTLK